MTHATTAAAPSPGRDKSQIAPSVSPCARRILAHPYLALLAFVLAACHEAPSLGYDDRSLPPVDAAPAPEVCPLPADSVLPADRLQEAARDLAARHLPASHMLALAQQLGVPCTSNQPGYLQAVASAIARFQWRTLPFTHEADGKLDDRTRRFLAMVHPSLRDEKHPCRRVVRPPPSRPLSSEQVDRAMDARAADGLSEAWVRELQRCLGASPSGTLDRDTTQRLAAWQRLVRVVQPAVRVHGRVDGPTLEALRRAFPRLANKDPKDTDPEGFLPACVLAWPQASGEQRVFMERVYEAQRVWAAQRRRFVGIVVDAQPIEAGSTASEKAARGAKAMLRAARASDANPRHRGDLKVVFGYRSAPMQVVLWEYHFPARYEATSKRRSGLPGGAHGDAAVVEMATEYAARTASPGYSLHSRGVALDLACVTPQGKTIGPTGRFLAAWGTSWCFSWLREHAREFGFYQNPRINEPWHWEHRAAPTPAGE